MPTVYHFTHHSNLPSIIQAGGIFCDSHMAAQGGNHANVGHPGIKGRRARRPVPVSAGGVVADYVPFYYAPRSPMLYAIHCNNVPECTYQQTSVVYLLYATADLFQACRCCFTDINAVLNHAQFSDNPVMLNTLIDWPLMRARQWANTATDTSRRERRMAEFLAHHFVPWTLVQRVVVYDATSLAYVQQALAGQQHMPQVSIENDWYF